MRKKDKGGRWKRDRKGKITGKKSVTGKSGIQNGQKSVKVRG